MLRFIVLCLLAASVAMAFPADTASVGARIDDGPPQPKESRIDDGPPQPKQGSVGTGPVPDGGSIGSGPRESGTPSGGCPGGYAAGAEVQRGRLVFTCSGGTLVPKGCIADDLSQIPVGGTFDKQYYRLKCQTGSDGQLAYEASGCIKNGQEHKVGETFEDGSSVYICKTDGSGGLTYENQGCVEGGKRVGFGEKISKENNEFTCEKTVNDGSKFIPSGCVKDGKPFNAGDAFDDGKIWFNCSKVGREKVVAKPAGCIAGGKRLKDGDRTTENDVIYECNVENAKVEYRAVACSSAGVERKLGCTWNEGDAEWQCVHDPAANTAKKVAVRCNKNVNGGVYNVEGGCFRFAGKEYFGCVKEGDTFKLQSFADEKAASSAGLKAC